MVFALGFVSGFVASTISFCVGLYFYRYLISSAKGETMNPVAVPGALFGKRAVRRKPKSVSEEEQWRREQERPPGDPT